VTTLRARRLPGRRVAPHFMAAAAAESSPAAGPDGAAPQAPSKRRRMAPLSCPACGNSSVWAVRLQEHMGKCCPDLVTPDLQTALQQHDSTQQQQPPQQPQQAAGHDRAALDSMHQLTQALEAAKQRDLIVQRQVLHVKYTGALMAAEAAAASFTSTSTAAADAAAAGQPAAPRQLSPQEIASVMGLPLAR
jgi:hypothetical protein